METLTQTLTSDDYSLKLSFGSTPIPLTVCLLGTKLSSLGVDFRHDSAQGVSLVDVVCGGDVVYSGGSGTGYIGDDVGG